MDREFKIIESSSEPCCKNVLWLTNEGFKKYINGEWKLYNTFNNDSISNTSDLITLNWNGSEGFQIQVLNGELQEGDELILSRYVNKSKGRNNIQRGGIKRFTSTPSKKESERVYKSIPFTKDKKRENYIFVDNKIIKDFFLEDTNILKKLQRIVFFKDLDHTDITNIYKDISLYNTKTDIPINDGDDIDTKFYIRGNFWRRSRKNKEIAVGLIHSDHPYDQVHISIYLKYNNISAGEIYYLSVYRNGKRISNYIPFNIYIGGDPNIAAYSGKTIQNINNVSITDTTNYISIQIDYTDDYFNLIRDKNVNITRI